MDKVRYVGNNRTISGVIFFDNDLFSHTLTWKTSNEHGDFIVGIQASGTKQTLIAMKTILLVKRHVEQYRMVLL